MFKAIITVPFLVYKVTWMDKPSWLQSLFLARGFYDYTLTNTCEICVSALTGAKNLKWKLLSDLYNEMQIQTNM